MFATNLKVDLLNDYIEGFSNIRTVECNGITWYCASDVAKCLGYKKPNDAINYHCKNVQKFEIPYSQSEDKYINMNFIDRMDVWRLVEGSRKKEIVEIFDRKILPIITRSIEHFGAYIHTKDVTNEFQTMNDVYNQQTKILQNIQEQTNIAREMSNNIHRVDSAPVTQNNIPLIRFLNQE